MRAPTNNLIAALCIVGGLALTVFIFSSSRSDPGLRMAALVSATTTVGSIITIASVILTGKDVTHPAAEDLPPNSSLQQTTTLKTITAPEVSGSTPTLQDPPNRMGGGLS